MKPSLEVIQLNKYLMLKKRRFAKLIQSYEGFIEDEGDHPSLEEKVEDANTSYLAVRAVMQTMIEERTTSN